MSTSPSRPAAPSAPSGGGSSDRRRVKRIRHRFNLRLWGDGFEARGFTRDVSVSGMLIETTENLDIGTRMHVEVSLPEERSYFCDVVVVRKKVIPHQARGMYKPALGVRIVTLMEAVRDIAAGPEAQEVEPDDGTLRVDLRSRGSLSQVYDRDIKHGALIVNTPHPPAVDDEVIVTLILPEPNGEIECKGIVVAHVEEPSGFGMNLLDLDMIRARLREILRS